MGHKGNGYKAKYLNFNFDAVQTVQLRLLAKLLKGYFPFYDEKRKLVRWPMIINYAVDYYLDYLIKYAMDKLGVDINNIDDDTLDTPPILDDLDE